MGQAYIRGAYIAVYVTRDKRTIRVTVNEVTQDKRTDGVASNVMIFCGC